MPTTLTGTSSGGTTDPVVISAPAAGDGLTSAPMRTLLQKILDTIQNVRANYATAAALASEETARIAAGRRAYAVVLCGNAGAATLAGAANVASASYTGNALTVNFTSALPSTNFGTFIVALSGTMSACVFQTTPLSTSSVRIDKYDMAGVSSNWANGDTVSALAIGG